MDVQWWCSAQGIPWTWEWRAFPGVWLAMAALAWAYFRLVKASAKPAFPFKGLLGLLLIWASLDWPIGVLGVGYLASVHALKFITLSFVVPPLLLSDLGGAIFEKERSAEGRSRFFSFVSSPLFTAVYFNAVLVATHTPQVVDLLARSQLGSFLNDAVWLTAGVLLWWPVFSFVRIRNDLIKALYFFLATISHSGLAMALLLASYPTYRVYELAPRVGQLAARTDQGLAGTAMLFGGTIVAFYTMGYLFFRAMRAHR